MAKMSFVELETGASARHGKTSKRGSSPAPRDGITIEVPAARRAALRLARSWQSARENVWAPVLCKIVGILGGMLALAAIGAAATTRGSGVPVPTASSGAAASFVAGGLAPLGRSRAETTAPLDAGAPSDAAPADAAPSDAAPADAGTPADAAPAEAGSSPGLTTDGKVVLNRASAEELRRLPGVGAKRAQAIVELRTKLGGRFKRASDLLRIKGIGPKGLRKMEPYLVLDAPG